MKKSYLQIGLSFVLTAVVLLSDLGAAFARRPRVRLNRTHTAAAQEMWRRTATNPRVSRSIRGWINHQIRQQQNIRRARQMGRRPPGGNRYRIKNPPGYDAGHRIPGIHTPENLRPELASMNRARPGIARRVERRLGRRINLR